ncbi:MAG: D-alanyl-D-alanine carboxypeptidase [Candidatus Kerfeldbacteria bacterium]|nr:D-alanyl-D-alanine carboxypeptidase [Candidatus Kerfeldbacteria bacterium]
MLNYLLTTLSFIATITTLALPQTISDQWYVVPTISENNVASLTVLPSIRLKPVPYKLDFDWGPSTKAKAVLIMDYDTGQVLWQKNDTAELPIASITKLMTALTALDYITDWNATYTMQPNENALGGASFSAGNGDEFTKHDILKAALVGSANNAAAALAHSTGLTQDQFVQAMNAKAQQLGLRHSHFVDPTGLQAGNTATVRDVANLMRTATYQPTLLAPLGQIEHRMIRQNNVEAAHEIVVRTTNRLIKNTDPFVLAGKTGFTYEAGNCLVSLATNPAGHKIIVAYLGADDPTVRFEESQTLIQWTYQHYNWP